MGTEELLASVPSPRFVGIRPWRGARLARRDEGHDRPRIPLLSKHAVWHFAGAERRSRLTLWRQHEQPHDHQAIDERALHSNELPNPIAPNGPYAIKDGAALEDVEWGEGSLTRALRISAAAGTARTSRSVVVLIGITTSTNTRHRENSPSGTCVGASLRSYSSQIIGDRSTIIDDLASPSTNHQPSALTNRRRLNLWSGN